MPDKVLDISDVLLMRLGSEKSLREPFSIEHLLYHFVAQEFSYTLLDQRGLQGAISDAAAADWPIHSSVDHAFVVLDWDNDSFISEDWVVFDYQFSNALALIRREMIQLELLIELISMLRLVKLSAECGVNRI